VLRWFYKVHKWVGVAVGVVLLMWIVTGVLLSTGEGRGQGRADPPDYGKATIAPAAAVTAATSGDSGLRGVRVVELDRLGDRVIYRVKGSPRGTALIDAGTGERIVITEPLARALAQRAVPGGAIESAELIRANDRGYPGSLPAWRVRFGDAEATWFHVSSQDGLITISTTTSRTSSTLHGLHTFGSLTALRIERRHIRLLLIGASLVALAVVVTGYVLSLPRRRGA
jgi:Na+-transporting NADH:ubiquinone oxidoreductase subunit F